MAVDLSDAVIDLESARSAARDAILSALDARPGRKALVMDPLFAPTLTSLCTMSELTEHGVDGLYQLEGGSVETECDEIVFMVKPRPALMAALNETVRGVILDNELDRAEHREQHGDDPALWDPRSETYDPDVPPPPRVPNMTVCFAPASTDACEGELRRLGVHDLLIRRECPVDLVPLEPDVFVADCDEAWRDLALVGDVSCVEQCARALHALQRRCGWATVVKGKGTAAKEIAEAMERMRREAFASDPALNPSLFPGNGHASDYDSSDENDDPNDDDADGGRRRGGDATIGRERDRRGRRFRPAHPGVEDPAPPASSSIDVLLIIDRDVDPVTPLCTQLTYEGFVDEAVGIKNGAVEVTSDDGSTTRVRLNSNDALFRELRDLNFGRACDALKEKTSSMQREYETIKGGKVEDQTVGEIGGFVKKLGEKQGLELHSNLAERCLETTRGGAGASADDNSAFMRGLEVERMCVEGRDLDKILEHLRNLVHTSGDDPRRTAAPRARVPDTRRDPRRQARTRADRDAPRVRLARSRGPRRHGAVRVARDEGGQIPARSSVSRDSQAAVAGGGRRRRPRPERRGVRVLAQRLRARVMQADPPRPHGLLSPHRRRPSSAPRAALRVHAGLRHARRFARRGRRRREVVPAAKGARGGGGGGRGVT